MAEEEQQPKRASRPRPESTIAQNFAADLDSMFGLGEVDDLSRTIEEKKYTVSSGQQQLQELEARLRETEQRLAKVSRHSSPTPQGDKIHTNGNHAAEGPAARLSPLAQKPTYPVDRPPTADRPPSKRTDTDTLTASMPGAMPQSPAPHYHGNNDYIMVDRNGPQAQRGYG
ncbi:hypothetical protein CERZMDRAFT_110249 [Cercospora zeae-maydis SCOH1-5]|uniref:Uncharacterized protein n=1 Tax=Cercospora zeae-maydis SCOH1-5 TaxID=717836 RepID=A0A6A6FMI8_9PEZI|nr:hypothetical protein CERZMDRAFT_110249 [Cercospora zeae-maydis SCOH1-5]